MCFQGALSRENKGERRSNLLMVPATPRRLLFQLKYSMPGKWRLRIKYLTVAPCGWWQPCFSFHKRTARFGFYRVFPSVPCPTSPPTVWRWREPVFFSAVRRQRGSIRLSIRCPLTWGGAEIRLQDFRHLLYLRCAAGSSWINLLNLWRLAFPHLKNGNNKVNA